jgi:hypothetical protein
MNDADFEEVERSLGFKLPAHYVDFMRSNGDSLERESKLFNLFLTAESLKGAASSASFVIKTHGGELPECWDDFFAIGYDLGCYRLMKRNGSPEVWFMDSSLQEEPHTHSPTLEAYVAECRDDFESKVGRKCVFVESGLMCLGIVESARFDQGNFFAAFKGVPNTFACRYRKYQEADEAPIAETFNEPPLGDRWDVAVPEKDFYLDRDYWDASPSWGGFKIFFDPEFVERFSRGDISWMQEFYE